MHRALLVASAFMACAGCNTISGVGKDMQAVGGALSKTADDAASGKAKTTKTAACLPDSRVPSRPCPAVKTTPKTAYAAAAKPKPKPKAVATKPKLK
jgi:predicted small secreted protein